MSALLDSAAYCLIGSAALSAVRNSAACVNRSINSSATDPTPTVWEPNHIGSLAVACQLAAERIPLRANAMLWIDFRHSAAMQARRKCSSSSRPSCRSIRCG